MNGRALMLQGTGSDVGKSVLVAGLCRALSHRGLVVRPFKPQNMSNNAAVADDGGEIGRAQWLQAKACGVPPSVHMNPVLLKPQSDTGAQVVVLGKLAEVQEARAYQNRKAAFLETILSSFASLKRQADLVLVEGAGSPAEVNLRAHDIANMGFALPTKTPVLLVADINRGGVIAALVGTHALLPAAERDLIKGYLINQFRGDQSLFDDGLAVISARTGWPSLGVVPHLPCVRRLPAEDAVALERPERAAPGRLRVATVMLPHIANFDDLDPLKEEADVELIFCPPGVALPAGLDLIVLPGTKSTLSDLRALKANGWHIDIQAHVRQGGMVLGLCGGYQMLGRQVHDPAGIEGPAASEPGLGLLEIETVIGPAKSLGNVTAWSPGHNCAVDGYEIHAGDSQGPDTARPFVSLDGRPLGAESDDGLVLGTYLHGLFGNDLFRQRFLNGLQPENRALRRFDSGLEQALDELAGALEEHLDVARLIELAQ